MITRYRVCEGEKKVRGREHDLSVAVSCLSNGLYTSFMSVSRILMRDVWDFVRLECSHLPTLPRKHQQMWCIPPILSHPCHPFPLTLPSPFPFIRQSRLRQEALDWMAGTEHGTAAVNESIFALTEQYAQKGGTYTTASIEEEAKVMQSTFI